MAENIDGRLNFKAVIDDSEYQKTAENMEKSINDVAKETDNATKSTKQFTTQTTQASTALGDSVKKVSGLRGALSATIGVFKQMAAAFGLLAGIGAVFAIINNAIQSVFDFDKAMTNMSAIAGKNRKDLKDVEGVIREVASTSINSANEVANLATELIKLGSTTEEVKKLIKPVNDLSIAFNASAEDTATLLKSMLNAFGAGADEANKYADVLAASANQTALGFQEIKDAFTYLSPAASAAGYSIEQAAAMTGVLVDNGIRASSAGRLLSSTLSRMAKEGVTLESQLDKVNKSQDKLATSTKLFGAESGKIGLILANNRDRINELAKGFEDVEGSLAVLTGKQLESFPAKVKMVTSAWEELVLSIDSGDGAMSNFVKGFLTGIADMIGAIAKLNMSAESKIGAVVSKRSDIIISQITEQAEKEKTASEKVAKVRELALLREKELLLLRSKFENDYYKALYDTSGKNPLGRKKAIEESEKQLKIYEQQIDAVKRFAKQYSGIKDVPDVVGGVAETEVKNDILKRRIALLEKISKIETANNNIVLSSRDKELESITAKYKELNIEAVKLGVNLSVINRISASETAEKNVANYKFDTDALAEELKRKEQLYTKYNDFAKTNSVASANQMYEGIIDASKDYFDYIEEEMNKINLVDITPQEKARYTMLLGLMDDYNNKRFEKEQSYFTEIYKLTETTEQKLAALREKYSKARSGLQNSYSGNELTERLANLERESDAEFSALFKTLTDRTKEFDDVASMIAGATKNQIRSQIESLRNYLNNAADLTKEQIEAINKTIRGLETSIVGATDDNKNISGSAAKFKDLRNETIRLNQEIKRLKESAKLLEVNGIVPPEAAKQLAEINAQVDGLSARIRDIPQDELVATADAFGEISSELSDMGNLFEGVDNGISSMFKTLSEVLKHTEKIIKAFDKMNDAIGAVGKTSESSTASSISSTTAGLGAWGAVVSAGYALAKIGADASDRASERRYREKIRLEELYYAEMKYQQLLGEGEIQEAKRNRFLEGRRKELLATKDQLMLLESQYSKIMEQFNDADKKFQRLGGQYGFGLAFSENDLNENIQKTQDEIDKLVGKEKESKQALLDMYKGMLFFSGKTIEELRKMNSEGLITGEASRIYEQLEEADKKAKELGVSLEDLIELIKEMNTGTSLDELSNAMSNIFLEGKDAVEDFGQTFEDVIKKAIVTSFRENYIKKEMQTLFDDLATAFEDDELTNSELEALRRKAEETARLAQHQWDRLTGGLGLDFGETTSSGNTPTDVIRKITESQANSIDGSLKGIQLVSIDSNNVLKNQLNVLLLQHEVAKESVMYLVEIRNNTLATANNTARLESIENSLISIDNATNNRQAQQLGIN